MSKKAGISEIYVTKFSGERQLFSRQKVVRTCRRMHASQDAAETVADKIESRLYDGITTKEILKLIFRFLKEHKPEVAFQLDLRESIALLRPKPDFEQFIALVLEAEGYEVERNLIIPGKCTEHEVDCIARRGRDIVYVEVKHHYRHHTFSGLGTFLEAWASFDDIREGYTSSRNSYGLNKLIVACNTKISDHAKEYAKCKGFGFLAWRAPRIGSLEQLVEEHRLYPVTFLKGIDTRTAAKLGDMGIVLLKQLAEQDVNRLARQLRMPKKKIHEIVARAEKVLKT